MTTREQVWTAVLSLLQANVPGVPNCKIKTYSRRMTLPGSLAPGDCPALMIWEQTEFTDDKGVLTPAIRKWDAFLVYVFRNPDKTIPGASLLNPVLEQVGTITSDPLTDQQTLGGLVQWVKIIGKTVKETGDTDPNGLGGFVVPLTVLVP